jgi:acetylserotonin N-methyltransferase
VNIPLPPSTDDRSIWDLWLSQYELPVVLAADELHVFELLNEEPAGFERMRERLHLPLRSVQVLLGALAAGGWLVKRGELFHLTDVARNYLLPTSEFYWVPMLRGVRVRDGDLMPVLRTENLAPEDRVSVRWERGEMSLEDARMSNARFHSHSMPAAVGLARNADFSGVRRMLDIAGGSGCYSIQLALHNPALRCTVAELPPVAVDTANYISGYGVADRVDTVSFNMFDDTWPAGYDAIFFSNIYHDWDPKRRADLSRSAFDALPSGGRILLHEMLLADGQDGPLPAALFSVMMLNTRGKQFSFLELAEELGAAGFRDARVQHTYAYYSLVAATKP